MYAFKADSASIPDELRPLFWDCSFEDIQWPADRDFIITRILSCGDWDAVQWLRKSTGDDELEDWLKKRHGASLSPERLRFWELVLHLPHRTVNNWIENNNDSIWRRRTAR